MTDYMYDDDATSVTSPPSLAALPTYLPKTAPQLGLNLPTLVSIRNPVRADPSPRSPAAGTNNKTLDQAPQSQQTRAAVTKHVEVCCIGAGISGLVTAVELSDVGCDSVLLIEKADGIGGTWHWNQYPGAACDVGSYACALGAAAPRAPRCPSHCVCWQPPISHTPPACAAARPALPRAAQVRAEQEVRQRPGDQGPPPRHRRAGEYLR